MLCVYTLRASFFFFLLHVMLKLNRKWYEKRGHLFVHSMFLLNEQTNNEDKEKKNFRTPDELTNNRNFPRPSLWILLCKLFLCFLHFNLFVKFDESICLVFIFYFSVRRKGTVAWCLQTYRANNWTKTTRRSDEKNSKNMKIEFHGIIRSERV